MHTVWFDHQIFAVQRYGGYTRYFVSLARALRELGRLRPSIVAPGYISELLQPDDPLHPLSFKLVQPGKALWLSPSVFAPLFRALAEVSRPDVVHETHHILPGWHIPKSAQIVATCHDMIIERYSDHSRGSMLAISKKRHALERASKIICISASTQVDLAHFYPELARRSVVVHHGVSHRQASTLVDTTLPQSFVLFVGMRNGYKNFQRGLRAMVASSAFRQGVSLVCFGGGKFSPSELALMDELAIAPQLIHCMEGDDELLAYCYSHALALFFPSEYEGFGMPLIEAMVQGCPVVCSGIPSLQEVCDGAAVFFDPTDVGSIQEALASVVFSEGERHRLAQLGRQRAQFFSWPRCAEATADVYLN